MIRIDNRDISRTATELDLSKRKIKIFPRSIESLSRLKKLNLSDNKITFIPRSIGNLKELKELNLHRNNLKSVNFIGNLRQLKKLNISENKLKSLPESIGKLKQLKELNLENTRLKSLPNSIGDLRRLETLNILENQLKSLPNSIGNLKQLKKLDIFDNELKSLPKSIGNLKQLEKLSVEANRLPYLPESIGNLTQLKELNISYNELKYLPESILNLTQLTKFIIESNPIYIKVKKRHPNFDSLSVSKKIGLLVKKPRTLKRSISKWRIACSGIGDIEVREAYIAIKDFYGEKKKENLSKEKMCKEITKTIEKHSLNTKQCSNKTVPGYEWDEFDPYEIMIVIENNKPYCLPITEIVRKERNPYTNQPFEEKIKEEAKERLKLIQKVDPSHPLIEIVCSSKSVRYKDYIEEIYKEITDLFEEEAKEKLSQGEMCKEITEILVKHRINYLEKMRERESATREGKDKEEKEEEYCKNDNILGLEWAELSPYEIILVTEGNANYCFTVEEMEKMDKNPYTQVPFSKKTKEEAIKRKILIDILEYEGEEDEEKEEKDCPREEKEEKEDKDNTDELMFLMDEVQGSSHLAGRANTLRGYSEEKVVDITDISESLLPDGVHYRAGYELAKRTGNIEDYSRWFLTELNRLSNDQKGRIAAAWIVNIDND